MSQTNLQGSLSKGGSKKMDPWEYEREKPPSTQKNIPVLLHFDVNKTVLLSDSLIFKTIEDGVREGIAELFWGKVTENERGDKTWKWSETPPSVEPPSKETDLMTYYQYVKDLVTDKDERKKAVRNFSLVSTPSEQAEMEKWVQHALLKMELPEELRDSPEAAEVGLKGIHFVMLPSFFHLVAALAHEGRKFAIVFRSFGDDHAKIKLEWNAFCELRHPVFSHLIKDIGPFDGTREGVPDRRVKDLHTLYRDADGPMLILDTFTNGPEESKWDSWAKSKPKPKEDTRGGREFVRSQLGSSTLDGVERMQEYFSSVLSKQETAAIKDDWAWWQFHGEDSSGGKLMPMIHGDNVRQVFFDDNVEIDNPRIVDVRYPDGSPVPNDKALDRLCVKVNPVEALLDKYYFLRKLNKSENIHRRSMAAKTQSRLFGEAHRSYSGESRRGCSEIFFPARAEAASARTSRRSA